MSNNFLQLIEDQVVSRPLKPAIQGKDTIFTYQQLWDEVARLRQWLKAMSVQRLAVALPNCPAWIALDLAAAMEHIVFVPVPHFFSPTQIHHLINDARVDHMIGEASVGELPAAKPDSAHGSVLSSLGSKLVMTSMDVKHAPLSDADRSDYFKISYTSGTTGEPKGVLISPTLVSKTVSSLIQTIGAEAAERHLSVLPYSLLLENIVGIYTVLASGGCCFVPDFKALGLAGSSKIEWQKFSEVVQSVKPTSMITVPALLQGLLHCVARLALDVSALKFVAVGGAPIATKLLEQAKALGLPVFQGYGMTECGSVVCLNSPANNRLGSVGKPLPHVNIQIDAQGEILINGLEFTGYSNAKISTPQRQWATGDLGYFDDEGFLVVTARKSSSYSTAYGRNIAPEWVESELDSESVIAQSVIFGAGQKRNVSVIVPMMAETPNTQLALAVEQVNQRLPDYAQIGAWIRADNSFNHGNGQRSAAGTLQRKQIYTAYQGKITQLFQETVS